ncbi:hypothetical protein PENTCL1PPCAC_22494 [Pristionchus entomophagus]|uniref:Protein-tyrosine-phosphatase n=1 Tax=Pristionchus entomophagus TaxID=358040 RepID=A0AAV5U0I9_9BILA|nr:hypothetical protein PENTCL1PPCAC_22494 [Pristionchus entomophagus]
MATFHVNPTYARIDQILPNLFISGVTALSPSILDEHGITYIINATNEVPNLRCLSHLARHKLWLDDTPETPIYNQLEETANQIACLLSEGHSILVHCLAGVSRSASLILAYLTKYHTRSLEKAFHLLQSIRPLVRPNIGFWRQLIQFESDLTGEPSTVRLVRVEDQDEDYLPHVYLQPQEVSSGMIDQEIKDQFRILVESFVDHQVVAVENSDQFSILFLRCWIL